MPAFSGVLSARSLHCISSCPERQSLLGPDRHIEPIPLMSLAQRRPFLRSRMLFHLNSAVLSVASHVFSVWWYLVRDFPADYQVCFLSISVHVNESIADERIHVLIDDQKNCPVAIDH